MMRIDDLPGAKSLGHAPYKDAPPHTKILCPVMLAAASDRRNAVSAATSSGLTNRPIGGSFGWSLARWGSLSIGVSVPPGAPHFTVTLRGASSMAQERAKPTMAALLAAY